MALTYCSVSVCDSLALTWQHLSIEQHLSCLGARGIQSALQNLSLRSFSLGSTVSVGGVEVLRDGLLHRCTNLESLSLSLALSRSSLSTSLDAAENGSPEKWCGTSAVLFATRCNSQGGPTGSAKLSSIRLQRCSKAIIPDLSQVINFCRAQAALRSIAIVRLPVGDAHDDQWTCSAADSRAQGNVPASDSDDPLDRLLMACTALESLELSAADAWPVDSLVRLMQTGGRAISGPSRGALIRRLTLHDTGTLAHKQTLREESMVTGSNRSDGSTSSPTTWFEAVRERSNVSAAVGVTREFFWGP
eukprot:COSAG02_NODE_677_length_18591_cov_105.949221_11_plen_304_part_00